MVVAVACLCTWYWLADLCADAGLPCVLGQALSLQAIHGGKATHDKSDSHKMAALLRGGRLPQASVSPAQMRATRALVRRRMPLAHQRAELLAHGPNTHSQSTLPALGQKSAYKATRDGVAERCADAAVPKSLAVDLALLTSDDAVRRDGELTLLTTAKHHEANTLSLRHTVPGIGPLLRLVLLSAIHPSNRCPSVQDVVSSCRRVTWATASAGKRLGTAGATIGQAHLQWAFAEAAVVCLSDHPAAQTYLARLETKHDKGPACTMRAHKLARAGSDRLTRQVAFETETCCQRAGRGADEPEASLDHQGVHRHEALERAACTASVHAKVPRGHETLRPAPVMGPPLSLLFFAALVAHGRRVLLLPRAWGSLDNVDALSPICA